MDSNQLLNVTKWRLLSTGSTNLGRITSLMPTKTYALDHWSNLGRMTSLMPPRTYAVEHWITGATWVEWPPWCHQGLTFWSIGSLEKLGSNDLPDATKDLRAGALDHWSNLGQMTSLMLPRNYAGLNKNKPSRIGESPLPWSLNYKYRQSSQ